MPVPAMEGTLAVSVKNDKEGVVVTENVSKHVVQLGLQSSFPLRVGDVITHLNGSPTPNLDAWKRVLKAWPPTGERPRIAGEPAAVVVGLICLGVGQIRLSGANRRADQVGVRA